MQRIGVECTGSYGAGLLRYMQAAGIDILEVTAPDKLDRRRRGKNDDFDAQSAAHAAFAKRRTVTPRSRDGMVESLRVLKVCRKTAVQARRVALQIIQTTIVCAPDRLRDLLRKMTRMQLIRTLAARRPDLSGYGKLYAAEPDGTRRLREAACWAHLRRDFHDFWASTKSGIAREALDRIGKLYDIERDINGQPADARHAARQKLSYPKVTAFFAWSEQQLLRIPGKSDLAKAFRYGLARQEAFSLFLSDGRVAIDNNPAERALRPIGIGRKNWLFAGADTGAETLARAMTVIETAKLNGLDPLAYLADILDRIHDHKINRLDDLLPWNWVPLAVAHPQAT